MKIIRRAIALLLVLSFFVPTAIFAEETDPPAEPAASEEPVPTEEPAEPVEEPSVYDEFLEGITEDSDLYPFKQLLEGINIEIVTDTEGNSTLVVSFANPELFNGETISADTLEALETALTEKIEWYLLHSEDDPDDTPTEEPEATPAEAPTEDPDEGTEEGTEEEGSGEGTEEGPEEGTEAVAEPSEEPVLEVFTIEFPLGNGLTEEQLAHIIKLAESEVGKLFVTEAFISIKDAFFQAKVDFINAMNAFKAIRKTGSNEDVIAALEAVMAAREHKDLMEILKDEVELMKEGIKDLLEIDDAESIGNGPKEESPSIMNKLESEGIGKGLIKEKKEKKEKKFKTNNGKKG